MSFTEQEVKELEADNQKLAEELAAKKNGERVVMLVSPTEYAEVISKSPIAVTLVTHNRYYETLLSEIEKRGMKPTVGYRVSKANGTVMYLVPTDEGPDVYTMGKCFPAVKRKKT
jgi:ATP-dependent 26S proteasome regulatory subunit